MRGQERKRLMIGKWSNGGSLWSQVGLLLGLDKLVGNRGLERKEKTFKAGQLREVKAWRQESKGLCRELVMGYEWLEDMMEWVMGNDIGGQLRNWYRDTPLNTDTETRTQKNKRKQSSGYLAPGSVSLPSGWARSRPMKPGRGAVTWPSENRES